MDIITLAMNMVCHGVDPHLDFSHLAKIRENYERLTGMRVYERAPYAGDLVFTAFSGSHQDAISKGMIWWNEGRSNGKWDVPYLPIDPEDIGREYESDVIRINSQSGKGGIAYILKHNFGIALPDKMKEEVGYLMKGVSDRKHSELAPADIYRIFEDSYVDQREIFDVPECHFRQTPDGITAEVTIEQNKERRVIETSGNGRLDAVSNAIKLYFGIKYMKEKSGLTFQEAVKQARMKKARAMLKESNKTVESIAASVGYENVEHFNRLFKKSYGMTPVQFRRESR